MLVDCAIASQFGAGLGDPVRESTETIEDACLIPLVWTGEQMRGVTRRFGIEFLDAVLGIFAANLLGRLLGRNQISRFNQQPMGARVIILDFYRGVAYAPAMAAVVDECSVLLLVNRVFVHFVFSLLLPASPASACGPGLPPGCRIAPGSRRAGSACQASRR